MRRARRWNGKHRRCANGLSATKAQTTSALPPRLLALVTFAPPFVRTPIHQATCILVTRRAHSLRLLRARSTARRLRRNCDSQRVAVRRRRPPWSSSVAQARKPSSHCGLAARPSWMRLRSCVVSVACAEARAGSRRRSLRRRRRVYARKATSSTTWPQVCRDDRRTTSRLPRRQSVRLKQKNVENEIITC